MGAIDVYVIDRTSGALKDAFKCSQWQIDTDYLSNEKSVFTTSNQFGASIGDFVMCKEIGETEIIKGLYDGIKPLYFGIIDSIEDDSINTVDIYNLANFDMFISYRKTSNGLAFLLDMYIYKLITNSNSKNASLIDVYSTVQASYPYSYLEDEASSINFLDWLIECFKKYRIAWVFDSVVMQNDDLRIKTKLYVSENSINIKNNVYTFANWSVYKKNNTEDSPNGLLIYDKDATGWGTILSDPTPLATYYLTEDGTIQQDSLNNVALPTYDKIYLYDTTAEDKPTYREVAEEELSGNAYEHEITFDIKKDNQILDYKGLEIGSVANIVYNGEVYESVLTGYSMNSESEFITLKFGNYRSNFTQVFLNLKNK